MSLMGFRAANHPQQADARGARASVDERATDPVLFAEWHKRWRFTVDAAALPHNAKLPRYFGPPDLSAASYRCMWDHPNECGAGGCPDCPHRRAAPLALDGLQQSWAGERVWCNPPYSNISAWVRKAWREPLAEVVVMLLPANRTEQGWWQDLVEPYRDREGTRLRVEFLRHRLRFIGPDATKIGPNERPPFGCCLLVWRRWPVGAPRAPDDPPFDRIASDRQEDLPLPPSETNDPTTGGR